MSNPTQQQYQSKSSPPETIPVTQQALLVLQGFRSARTTEEYLAVSEKWSYLRPKLRADESRLACEESGAASDRAIAKGVIEDLIDAPVELIVAFTQLIFALAGSDKDEFLEALEKTFVELKQSGWDTVKGKATAKSKEVLEKASGRLREALLKYLQAYSKRSRKHLSRLLDAALGTLKGIGGTAAKSVQILLTSTRITPEWCGLYKQVEESQDMAFRRILPYSPNTLSNLILRSGPP